MGQYALDIQYTCKLQVDNPLRNYYINEGQGSVQACLERLAAGLGLLHALLAQVRVEPAAELVLLTNFASIKILARSC